MRVLKVVGSPRGFSLLPIHWSHDPNKTIQWASDARASYPRPTDWDKEMEIDFGLHVGSPAYPRFSDAKHVVRGIRDTYDPRKPLYVGFDFNVNPMSVTVDQLWRAEKRIHVIKEFVYGPTTIDHVVADFRRTFSEHRSDIKIYGDATSGRNAQTATGNWEVVRLGFRGFHIQPEYNIPPGNPNIGNRLLAVNKLLTGEEYSVLIDVDCIELIRDLREVVMTNDGHKIKKVTDPSDEYYFRTGPSDAWGYRVFAEHSVVDLVVSDIKKKREPLQFGRLLGETHMGTAKQEAARKGRPPLDKSRMR